MILLIAESKTMAPCDLRVDSGDLLNHTPLYQSEAESIMLSLQSMTAEEIAETVKISLPLGRKLRAMAYEFPDRQSGSQAITAFTGVVFKAFSYSSLLDAAKKSTAERVRIISSLYGWLTPDDIIKPYRLDFTTQVAPGGESLAPFWRPKVTAALRSMLADEDRPVVLNLLPGDAARCIDWKSLGPEVKVWKADFKEVRPGGDLLTPRAGTLKQLRGELLRQIILEDITDPRQLGSLEGENFFCDGMDEKTGIVTFHSAHSARF